jgi:hypothetical protein
MSVVFHKYRNKTQHQYKTDLLLIVALDNFIVNVDIFKFDYNLNQTITTHSITLISFSIQI